jgi:hypothetical protein
VLFRSLVVVPQKADVDAIVKAIVA